eukprot:scaffold32159_cov35-Prasinocladus_malaysianus.AAC.1
MDIYSCLRVPMRMYTTTIPSRQTPCEAFLGGLISGLMLHGSYGWTRAGRQRESRTGSQGERKSRTHFKREIRSREKRRCSRPARVTRAPSAWPSASNLSTRYVPRYRYEYQFPDEDTARAAPGQAGRGQREAALARPESPVSHTTRTGPVPYEYSMTTTMPVMTSLYSS